MDVGPTVFKNALENKLFVVVKQPKYNKNSFLSLCNETYKVFKNTILD